MSGKKQRTKGNLKPSSSSKAAELLAAGGGSSTGFIGFGTLGSPAFVPAAESFDDADNCLDADFRITLRKFSKRDTTTKIKGLQEFRSLCQEKDNDVLLAVLPFWPRIYNKLAIDFDHKVREAAQSALGTLASQVGRNLAPHLRSIMGTWLLSQCDVHPTVATAAAAAFRDASLSDKLSRTVSHCKNDIFQFLTDMIINQTPTTLSDPKNSVEEEMESKYQRALAASLFALRKACLALPPEDLPAVEQFLSALLKDGKFWKLAKHDNIQICSGFFQCVCGLCQSQSQTATEFVSKLSSIVVNSLDCTDPPVCAGVWEALLSLTKFVPSMWEHVNWQKAFCPKLRAVLENGCHGNAAIVGPNLLPLLGHLPGDKADGTFLSLFFGFLKTGLAKDNIRASVSDSAALVKAMMECCQFVIKKNPQPEAVSEVLHNQVLPLVGAALLERNSPLARTPLFRLLPPVLEVADRVAPGEQLSEKFWSSLLQLLEEHLLSGLDSEVAMATDRLVMLVQGMLGVETGAARRGERVKFAGDTAKGSPSLEVVTTATPVSQPTLAPSAMTFLTDLEVKVFSQVKQQDSDNWLPLLSRLLTLHAPVQFFSRVVASTGPPPPSPSLVFLREFALPRLRSPGLHGNAARHLLALVFVCLKDADADTVTAVLEETMESMSTPDLMCQLVSCALDQRLTLTSVGSWLRSRSLSGRLAALATQVCQQSLQGGDVEDDDESDGSWRLISLVLSSVDSNSEPVFEASCIQDILVAIGNSLSKLSKSVVSASRTSSLVQVIAKTAQTFFVNLKMCLSVPSAENLALALLQVSLQSSAQLDSKAEAAVEQAWTSAVQIVVQNTGAFIKEGGLLQSACMAVCSAIQQASSSEEAQTVTQVARQFLGTVQSAMGEVDTSDPTVQTLISSLFVPLHLSQSHSLVQACLLVEGDFGSACELEPPAPTSEDSETSRLAAEFDLELLLLSHPAPSSTKARSDQKEEEEAEAEEKLQWTEEQMERLADVLTAAVACVKQQSLDLMLPVRTALNPKDREGRHVTEAVGAVGGVEEEFSEDDLLVATSTEGSQGQSEALMKKTTTVIENLSSQDQGRLLQILINRSEQQGLLSALALRELCQTLQSCDSLATVSESCVLDRMGSLSGRAVLTVQAVLASVSPSTLDIVLDLAVSLLSSVQLDQEPQTAAVTVGPMAVLRTALACLDRAPKTDNKERMQEVCRSVVELLLQWRQNAPEGLLLSDCDLADVAPDLLLFNVEVVRLLRQLLTSQPDSWESEFWDFCLCSLATWVQAVGGGMALVRDSTTALSLATATLDLAAAAAACIQDRLPSNADAFPPNLTSEWAEFFSDAIFSTALRLFVDLAGEGEGFPLQFKLLQHLGLALQHCPAPRLLQHDLPPRLVAGESSPLPDTLQSLLNHLCPLLLSPHRAVQLTSHALLARIVGELTQHEKEKEEETDASEGSSRSPPAALVRVLLSAGARLALLGGDVEAEVQLSPLAPPTPPARAFLLAWQLLLQVFRSAKPELRAEYSVHLKESGLLSGMLGVLFTLMPKPAHLASASSHCQNLFDLDQRLNPTDEGSYRDIWRLACQLYRQALVTVPALVRQWWLDQDRKTSGYVNKFTIKFVSPLLISSELSTISPTDFGSEDMTVKTRVLTREVIASYIMQEVNIEIVITLPENYPLGVFDVKSDKRVGVTKRQWELWILKLVNLLQHQNGTISEGLKLWKRNIDKRFEGVEECNICFSVLHDTNYQLPRLACKTCRNRFHSACLYTWFNKSHQSTCPLCRNLF